MFTRVSCLINDSPIRSPTGTGTTCGITAGTGSGTTCGITAGTGSGTTCGITAGIGSSSLLELDSATKCIKLIIIIGRRGGVCAPETNP